MSLSLPLKIALSQRELALAGVPGWVDVTPPQYRLIESMGAPCRKLPEKLSKRGYTRTKARWLAPKGVAEIVACYLAADERAQLAPLEVRKRCLADCRDCPTLAEDPTVARQLVRTVLKAEGWVSTGKGSQNWIKRKQEKKQ